MWWLFIIKYISAVIAVFSTTLFISNLVSSWVAGPSFILAKDEEDKSDKMAAFRVLCGIIMAISWGVIIVF